MKNLIIASLISMQLPVATAVAQDSNLFKEMDYRAMATRFTLNAPADSNVWLRLYESADAPTPFVSLQMKAAGNNRWVAECEGDLKGKFYTFDVGRGETPGVFAKAVGLNGKRGAIVDLAESNPAGWADDRGPRTDGWTAQVIYEMHHRDFSIARTDARYPGKFLALTEPWAIQHLKDLGITAVHILPSYDFGSVDESRPGVPQYNWGYDPVNYNVPEGSYSTNAADPLCRIREFKQMVQQLHKAGIAVVLDVVYNHTYDIDHSNFQRTYPDYYYRKTTEGYYSNGSGCGNETASERPLMRQFMIESVKYWIREYHIDGFRFDLMGCHDIETMNAIRKAVDEIDPTIFIYGEGWSAGSCGIPNEQLGMKANIPQMPRIAAFSDDIRDALRGPFSDDKKCGWLGRSYDPDQQTGAVEYESLKAGIAGMVEHPQVDYAQVNYSKQPYAIQPTQMMSYVSCHDDMCLVDRLKASIPSLATAPDNQAELIRLDLLAQTAVFTSQGVPFMLSGEELLRDKKGVHNSFESPDSINHLDWSNKDRFPQVYNYYKNLIALRKHHPAFHLGVAELVRQHLEFLPAVKGKTVDNSVLAYRLKGHAGGDAWENIIVVLNASRDTRVVPIPKGRYTVVCREGVIDEQGLGRVNGSKVKVAPQSALILHD
ncbi:MAG: type I pullulanase [Prevotella sp.]|nr:type I pullulanase [Prevotella sp.]